MGNSLFVVWRDFRLGGFLLLLLAIALLVAVYAAYWAGVVLVQRRLNRHA